MSGFLPDIASWALGGGAGDDTNEESSKKEESTEKKNHSESNEMDVRAKRLARMSGESTNNPNETEVNVKNEMKEDAMEIDEDCNVKNMELEYTSKKEAYEEDRKLPAKPCLKPPLSSKKDVLPSMQAKKDVSMSKKLQRKKLLLVKNVLNMDEIEEISVENVAEILAARLALPVDSEELKSVPKERNGVIWYLSNCHREAGNELRALKENKGDMKILIELLEEIRRQVVSYAASSLFEPDLFELASNSKAQLAKCLSIGNASSISIAYGVWGPTSSFYFCLCEEMLNQDKDGFGIVISDTVTEILSSIPPSLETIMNDECLNHVNAITSLCSFKKAAVCLTKHPSFLLPSPESPKSKERVSNQIPTPPVNASSQQQRFFRMMQALSQGRSGYLRRSGPALEKDTILGSVLRFGLPMEHSSVTSNFTQAATRTQSDVNRSINSMRRQLRVYQEACNVLFRSLVTAGTDARNQLFQFIIDFLLVNSGAAAMRPDKSKVCHYATIINLCVVLLKLCEPFLLDEKKSLLIDAGFVSSEKNHGGVFELNGENSVPRLSENPQSLDFNPKNTFIPQCFFFTARALHLGLIPSTTLHSNLIRQVNHTAYMVRQRNSDLVSDPNFNHILSIQYAHETTVLMPELLTDSLRFYNTAAGVLLRIDDNQLNAIPEHIVDDLCELVVFVARFSPKVMSNIDFGNVFKIVVKLLSPKYAQTVHNYNLRAKLGDVLYEVFLPRSKNDDSENSSSDVPSSVSCDPLMGGQPYLLSNVYAQETLAPSLLLLYGEVEQIGFYEKMSHRSHIASLLKYLWESKEHRPAFRRITQNKTSFIKFANGIMNETNSLMASIMEKLPEIRNVQLQMASPQQWAALTEEERETITSRHEENEMEVKRALPLCNKTLQMLGFLNTDVDIRNLFLLDEMCPRLVNMLLHVMTKLVGAKGLQLKVDNPESYHFRPKEMLRDLCLIFASFTFAQEFQTDCARSGYYKAELLQKSIKTCKKLNLLPDDVYATFASLPEKVSIVARNVENEAEWTADAPEQFLDPLMFTLMKDPVLLPTSNNVIDRATITQHLLNDPCDPFNRKELSIDMVVPDHQLKQRIEQWLDEKRRESNP